ncbi:P-loop containing nucleoside triphosphate hydrolase protein [Amylostereum chailletii]|nr:P-loop containing nucleoside triphosphate hydrolase protein [Amylostereum chailletii]
MAADVCALDRSTAFKRLGNYHKHVLRRQPPLLFSQPQARPTQEAARVFKMVAKRCSIPSRLTFRSSDDLLNSDSILVGDDVWRRLNPSHSEAERVAVSLSSLHPFQAFSPSGVRTNQSPFTSLTSWAVLGETEGLVVPPDWSQQYDWIFHSSLLYTSSEPTHAINAVRPIPLQEVFVQAQTPEAYNLSKSNLQGIEAYFCEGQRILRQGSSYHIDPSLLYPSSHPSSSSSSSSTPSSYTLPFKIIMTEPVLQGYARPQRTTFVLLPPIQDAPLVNGHVSSLTADDSDISSEDDDLEIDEGFLARSINPLLPNFFETERMNGDVTTLTSESRAHYEFVAKPLVAPIAPLRDDHTVYVRTADLSKIGLQDGDWAVLQFGSSPSRRAVRLQANDDVVGSAGFILASPTLLYNLHPEVTQQSLHVLLQAPPEGLQERSLPTAHAITIARVASKISTNRIYQPLVLQALKSFFDGKRRLIRQGDILAVKVDLEQLHLVDSANAEDGEAFDPPDEEPTAHSSASDSLVYFVVTDIDCRSPNGSAVLSLPNFSVGLAMGELGCWIDSTETRMIQTGVEHARIPNVARFLGLTTFTEGLEMENEVRNNGPAFAQIHGLVSAALVRHALSYDIPISILLKGARGIGKSTAATQIAGLLGLHLFEINCYDIIGETDAKTEGFLRARFDQMTSCSPCILVMRNIDAFTQTTQGSEPGNDPAIISVIKDLFSDLSGSWRLSGYPVLVFGTTSEPSRIPGSLLSCFKHEVEFEAPGEGERASILRTLVASKILAPDVSITDLARRTAAFVAGDLAALVKRTDFVAMSRIALSTEDLYDPDETFQAGVALTQADFDTALEEARSSYSQNIGAPKIPNVSWDDVGGLGDVKADILDTIQLPLEHPELFSQDLKKRSGILLYGPPGTGKTLLAKAVATSFSLNFFSVKGPELLNMYIGESEANVRRVFQRARDARPCVIFFDELDSVAPKRGNHGDSGGVMDRIVSQLLAELDGISAGEGGDVFVIGATNRPDLLDPALLRPGRFDRMLYLGISDTNASQLKILQALTRKFRLDPGLDLMLVVERCPFNFTGADFYALCSDALLKAMTRKAEDIDTNIALLNQSPPSGDHPHPITPQYFLAEMAPPADIEVTVSQADFDGALRELAPSVSQAEMEHYARIQKRFSRKADDPVSEAEEEEGMLVLGNE